ncbi:MAG TPA: hypothetical protein VGW33_13955 [Terriglobia bacterium]|nr:hypothetical protein [Terriglobia bacterium]
MSLRKSPVRSAALLAACRANSQHSTGPRTPTGKARVALNALRHGRRAPALARLLPRGLSFEDRLLYNWIFRAIRNSFLPQKALPEGSGKDAEVQAGNERRVGRVAIQVWCQVKAELKGKNDDQSVYVTDYKPLHFEHSRPDLICFRLEREHPNGLLTFRTHAWGRNPHHPLGPVGPADKIGGWRTPFFSGVRHPGDERPRVRTVRALWRGDCTVEDWDPEPLPDPETDPAGFYHWRRDIQRQYRTLQRAEAREAREEQQEENLEPLADWLAELRAVTTSPQVPHLDYSQINPALSSLPRQGFPLAQTQRAPWLPQWIPAFSGMTVSEQADKEPPRESSPPVNPFDKIVSDCR